MKLPEQPEVIHYCPEDDDPLLRFFAGFGFSVFIALALFVVLFAR